MPRRAGPLEAPRPHPVVRPVVADATEAVARLRTVRDLVRYAVSRFAAAGVGFGHGTGGALDEAVWLACWSLHLPVEHYAEFADAAVTETEARAALALIARRCGSGAPLAYLIGEAWLMGHRFRCDARALVPRSLIAEALADGRFDAFAGSEGAGRARRVLDLCTGGASLAIIAAHRFPEALVVGSDLSAAALELAADNVADHELQRRVRLVHCDLFDRLGRERFDLILCNPPYVNSASMASLPAEYRSEPQSALAGGADGMDLVARILAGAARHLRPGGLLVLEIGHEVRHFVARFPRLEWAGVPVAQGDDRVVAIERDALEGAGPETAAAATVR